MNTLLYPAAGSKASMMNAYRIKRLYLFFRKTAVFDLILRFNLIPGHEPIYRLFSIFNLSWKKIYGQAHGSFYALAWIRRLGEVQSQEKKVTAGL
ncbi:MAG: hypothetical protein GX491_10265 [Chloroflexi bacterium]|nr:hypothetical protein [Chloroflexota bacterium]